MSIKRIVKEVYVCFHACTAGDYDCGYNKPIVHILDAGNPPGSQVVDVRCEFEPLTAPPKNIVLPAVDVVDDTHISMTCAVGEDVTYERAKVRIIILIFVP